jgi:hypothetical protein
MDAATAQMAFFGPRRATNVDRTVADPLSSSSRQTGPVSSSIDQPIDYSPAWRSSRR